MRIKVPSLKGGGGSNKMFRTMRKFALWSLGLSVFFVFAAWMNLPTRQLAWRIGHEAQRRGVLLDVQEVGVRPWGTAVMRDVTWNFEPSRAGQRPVPFVVDEAVVDVSMLSYLLFDEIDVELDAALDEGTVLAAFEQGTDASSVSVHIADLPLYSVPKLQQGVNAPLDGTFNLDVDLTLPEGAFSAAEGTMEINCESCTVGDGQTPFFVPGVEKGMLGKGVTIPMIDVGTLNGRLKVEDGVATAEEFQTQSEHITIKFSGQIEFDDPVQRSRLDLIIKVFVSESLLQSDDNLNLLIGTASPKAKMDPPDDGWLGFRLTGTFAQPKFRGIKAKSREERLREHREKRRNAKRDRDKRKAERDKERAARKKEREEAKAAKGEDGSEADEEDVTQPSPREVPSPAHAAALKPTFDEEEGGEEGDAEDAEDEEDEEEDDEEEEEEEEEDDEEPEAAGSEGGEQIIQ